MKFFGKKTCLVVALALMTLVGCSSSEQNKQTTDNQKVKHIAITAIVEHPALDATREGVLAELKAQGFEEGKTLKVDFQSAQGNIATAGQIAKKFVGDNPDVIVAIATPSAQSVVAATKNIPVVFSAVTDPVAAKLVSSWQASGTNVTGASDEIPLEQQVDLLREVIPNLKSVGYVYSPGEINSTVVLERLKKLLEEQNVQLVAAPAQRTTDIPAATRSLKGKVDVIYTSLDNNVVSAYEAMYKVAVEEKIPLVASDTDSVPRGAIAALGINYHDLGIQTGKVVARILNGEAPGAIPPTHMEKLDLYVSPKHAEEQGIRLPQSVIEKATKVVD